MLFVIIAAELMCLSVARSCLFAMELVLVLCLFAATFVLVLIYCDIHVCRNHCCRAHACHAHLLRNLCLFAAMFVIVILICCDIHVFVVIIAAEYILVMLIILLWNSCLSCACLL